MKTNRSLKAVGQVVYSHPAYPLTHRQSSLLVREDKLGGLPSGVHPAQHLEEEENGIMRMNM